MKTINPVGIVLCFGVFEWQYCLNVKNLVDFKLQKRKISLSLLFLFLIWCGRIWAVKANGMYICKLEDTKVWYKVMQTGERHTISFWSAKQILNPIQHSTNLTKYINNSIHSCFLMHKKGTSRISIKSLWAGDTPIPWVRGSALTN